VVQRDVVNSYDAAGRTTATRDADGWVNKTAFDPTWRVTGTTDALGNKTLSAYDLSGQSTASRNQLGNQPGDKYNLRGWVTSSTDALGNVATTAYDAAGNATAVTDALNHTTTYLYDALGRSTGQSDPLGHRLTTTYDADGNVSTVSDANGNVVSYSYDALDRQTMTTEAVGTGAQRSSTVAYDAVGNVTSSTDFLGNRTTTAYDALNRATVVTDPLGHTVTTAYDADSNVTKVTDALSKATSYAYDALNRLLATTDPLGHVATQVVDAAGDAIARIDPLGDYARAVYDQLHRAVGTLDLRGGYTQTGYDGAGGTTAVTDSVGNTTVYVNDRLGRQSVATDPTGARTTTTYDAAGNVSTVTDRDGREQVFHYDNANRLTAATWLSSAGVTVNLLTYTYDSNNNQLTAADYNGTITSGYDALNRLTSQTDVFGLALTYQYDASSRVTQRTDSKGGLLTYVYDTSDRLTSERLTGSGSAARVDLGYDNRNELTSLTRFTDAAGSNLVGTTVYAYDDAQRLTSIVNKTGAAATLSYYQYTLDNAGRVTQESWQSENTTGGVISGTHTYAYDTTNQLTAADGTVYNWDLNGNSTNASKQTGSANRLTNDGTYTYTYDAQGNLTQQSKGSGLETWYYGYNTLNQLTSVRETTDGTTNELTVTYTYDVLGRRVEEDRWATGGAVTVTRTAYDDNGVAWADLSGSSVVQTRYLAGPGANQWFAQIISGGDQWLLTDRLGSVRDVVGAAGTLVQDHTEYQAFLGVASDTSASAASAYGAQGERQDRAAHLVKADRRVWDTVTMQWLQEDPWQYGGGDGNPRRGYGNDPTNAVDPRGTDFIALADRGIFTKKGKIFNHYSIEYWLSATNPTLPAKELSTAELQRTYTAVMIDSVELLPSKHWNAWIFRPARMIWDTEDFQISVLSYWTSRANWHRAVFVDTDQNVKDKWDELIKFSQIYPFAEQRQGGYGTGLNSNERDPTEPQANIHWPQSQYQDVFLDPPLQPNKANNSNTFARWLLRRGGIPFDELSGTHPGARVAHFFEAANYGNAPWKDGDPPLPKP
jgi:RHS repeat-associated protein